MESCYLLFSTGLNGTMAWLRPKPLCNDSWFFCGWDPWPDFKSLVNFLALSSLLGMHFPNTWDPDSAACGEKRRGFQFPHTLFSQPEMAPEGCYVPHWEVAFHIRKMAWGERLKLLLPMCHCPNLSWGPACLENEFPAGKLTADTWLTDSKSGWALLMFKCYCELRGGLQTKISSQNYYVLE